ncbi:MAG: YfhO family protein [Cytophagales bacterium]|nr:YfhO family protein [Cytophagales bacterium]
MLAFVVVSLYFAPLYGGKTLVQSDNVQLAGTNKELRDYQSQGETIGWTNKEFSGLPLLTSVSPNVFHMIYLVAYQSVVPKAVMMVFTLFIGFFVLARVLGVRPWVGAMVGLAFAFSSFNIISIEAGHDNKVLAIAFMAPVLAGVIYAYRGQWLAGFITTFLAAGFQLLFGHIQITYYSLLMVAAYLLLVLVQTAKSKTWMDFVKASLVLGLATGLAFGCNFGKLYATLEYADYSTRGGSELSASDNKKGLDKEYATQWSNGVMETFTLLFPYFHGGASQEELSEKSQTYQVLKRNGVDAPTVRSVTQNAPLYWGQQPFTAGPMYFGVLLCLFFVVALFIVKEPIRWWALALTVLSLLLAMGHNLSWVNDLFFYYFPLYNKFRSVTMLLSITQLSMAVLAVLALQHVLEATADTHTKNALIRSSLILAGLGLFFWLTKTLFFDFKGASDGQFQFPDWLIEALIKDRKSKFDADLFRSIFLVLLIGGLSYGTLVKKIKPLYALVALFFVSTLDLWLVNKRYLGADDYKKAKSGELAALRPSPANQEILKDKSYYRVFNVSANPFSDGITSYHHYSIGGYNAIKMQRYQELIDRHLSRLNRPVLNMLNAKYFITKSEQGPQAQRNPDALGNAWCISDVRWVDHADAEIAALDSLDTKTTAVIDERFRSDNIKDTYSGQGEVVLSSYHPEKMVYSFQSNEDQLVVFSEIYYAPGWNAYIDGQEAAHLRANYVLRALPIPKGEHSIEF